MRAARKLHTIQGNHSSVLEQIQALKISDKAAEESVALHQNESTKGCAWSGGGCLGMMLIGAIAQQGVFDGWPEWSWKWTLVVCMVAIVAGMGKHLASSSSASAAAVFDLDDHRYEGLERVHNFFSTDCSPNATYSYKLELRPYNEPEYLTKEDKFGGLFSYPKGSTKFFEIPVLSGRVKLRDGTLVQFKAIRFMRLRAYDKKSRSGKIKSKRKTKYKDLYQFDVKLPQALVGRSEAPDSENPEFCSWNSSEPQWRRDAGKVRTMVKVPSGTVRFSVKPLFELGLWTFRRLQSEPS